MELVFPFRNLAINTFWYFLEKEKVKYFSDFKAGRLEWIKWDLSEDIDEWKGRIPNMENEILQLISTTDQKTIDEYCRGLYSDITGISSCLNKEYFQEKISEWNSDILKKYDDDVERNGREYADHPDRKNDHLQELDDWEYDGFTVSWPLTAPMKRVKRTNYNYYCIEELPELISLDIIDEYLDLIGEASNDLNAIGRRYLIPWKNGELKSKIEERFVPKPIIFVERDHDSTLITKAAELLGKTGVLERIEIRQRGGFRNLDKLWSILTEDSWETINQKKIFLYDCDTNKSNQDFGNHFKRIIPTTKNSRVLKGIENLFPNDFIERAIGIKSSFVDIEVKSGIRRGNDYREEIWEINKDEKKNFCLWACENGTIDDFRAFIAIFEIIEELI